MKNLILFLLSCTLTFASSLQGIKYDISLDTREALLKEFSSSSKLYISNSYQLKDGWNKLVAPKDGVNVVKTFNDTSKIKYVLTYYELGKLWAIYAPNENFRDMLFLKYLEPNVTFFVLANKDTTVEIKSNHLSNACASLAKEIKKYALVTDSGRQRDYTLSSDATMLLQSRYYSHHDRGIYNDTRVTLIYPKLKSDKKKTFKYGPANPKVAIKFPKAYEGKLFYIYDYKQEKCFAGRFPSIKIPPFPTLKELK